MSRAPTATASLDVAVIGMGVMGSNLALNLHDAGHRVAVYNYTPDLTREFMAGPARHTSITPYEDLADLVAGLARPRRLLLMVTAGAPVDAVIARLRPLLEPGDIIVDGGNSHHQDTARRERELAGCGIHHVGMGISGGAAGARHGPSLMPGGAAPAWPQLRPLLHGIAARVDGEPCCVWTGGGGSGHFVKMVHNGIEYAEMQLLAESYQLLTEAAGLGGAELSRAYHRWNRGKLDSYLVGITAEILAKRDDDGELLIEKVSDRASQKGTGAWTVASSLEHGVPHGLAAEAVYARFLSTLVEERRAAEERLAGPEESPVPDTLAFLRDLESAVYAARIVGHAQGFMLLRAAAREHGWELDGGRVAHAWRGGCIIRSRFMAEVAAAYERDPYLPNLLLDPRIGGELQAAQAAWRRVVRAATDRGIPIPVMGSALAFYDGLRRGRLPTSLIQAQRDQFGAHTYERTDRPAGERFHTDWSS